MSTNEQPTPRSNTMTKDEQLAFDTITACNNWIAEAKPLLERGGKAERELAQATALLREITDNHAIVSMACSMPRSHDMNVKVQDFLATQPKP